MGREETSSARRGGLFFFFFLQREEGENQSAQGTASDGRLLRRRIQADCNGCLIAVESFVDARTLQGTSAGQSERRTACNERPATSRRSAHIDALWRRLEETAGGRGGRGGGRVAAFRRTMTSPNACNMAAELMTGQTQKEPMTNYQQPTDDLLADATTCGSSACAVDV